MLTPAQREDFERTGLLHLPGAVPSSDTAVMCDRIWEHTLENHGIRRTDPGTWRIEERLSGLQRVASRAEFSQLGSPTVRAALDDLLAEHRWEEPRRWGRLLVTFPHRAPMAWDVPPGPWHNDFVPFQAGSGLRAVQLFVLLNDIRPRGGATLVLAGSHRIVTKYTDQSEDGPHPKRLRQKLGSAHPWLRELWAGNADSAVNRVQKFMVEGAELDGVPLRVVELCGQAGDVFVMHCDTFHLAAPNCLDQPRMMATNIIGREQPEEGRPSS